MFPMHADMNYKTTEYLRMKGVLDSIELRMRRRADYMRERNILGESHFTATERRQYSILGMGGQIVPSYKSKPILTDA